MTVSWLLMAAHVPPSGRQGGMVRYVVEMARGLAAHEKVDLHVVAGPGTAPFWRTLVEDDHIHPMVGLPAAASAWLERRGRGSAAFGHSFDVVHAAKHILPRDRRGFGLLTVHDFLPLDRPQDFGYLKKRLLPGPYLDSIARADALLCVSQATADRLVCYVPSAAGRTHVVPLAGGALAASEPVPVAALRGRQFAVVVGDSSARKNLSLLTSIWPRVTQAVPDALLAIVGPPSWRQDASGPADPANVMRLGFLTDAELAWCYRNAAVVLCPSLLEGFGLPAREALDLGAPVITSDDPALCEVSGDQALHIPARDQIGWTEAVVAAMTSPRQGSSAGATRTWSDVVDETVEVVTGALVC